MRKVMVLGSRSRDSALAWRILHGDTAVTLFVAPGNAGTAQIATNVEVNPENADEVAAKATSLGIDFVVVGPENPLAQGVVDRLQDVGIPAFGPTQAAARLETSKSFALGVMEDAHIPHPKSRVFFSPGAVETFIRNNQGPFVIKADGLTGGKGVWVCSTPEEAVSAAYTCADTYPGSPIIVQERLAGREVSVFCFTDGYHISPPIAACDYKRLRDGDKGPNTGSMGSYAWPEFWSPELASYVMQWIIRPVIRAMEMRGIPFSGMLYAGLMVTKDGPMVLEFNCRFGDSEAQVILPLLKSDPLEVMLACTKGRLDTVPVLWDQGSACVGVVLAANGYPGKYESGHEITGLGSDAPNCFLFHGGTKVLGQKIVTSGTSGRIVTIVGKGASIKEARKIAYRRAVNINYKGKILRTDIGLERI